MSTTLKFPKAAAVGLAIAFAPLAGASASIHVYTAQVEALSVQECADAIVRAVEALGPDATTPMIEAAIIQAILDSGVDAATAAAALAIASASPALSSPQAQAAVQSVLSQLAAGAVAGVPGGPGGAAAIPAPPAPPGGRGGSDY